MNEQDTIEFIKQWREPNGIAVEFKLWQALRHLHREGRCRPGPDRGGSGYCGQLAVNERYGIGGVGAVS